MKRRATGLLLILLLLIPTLVSAQPSCPSASASLNQIQERQTRAGYAGERLTRWHRSETPKAKAVVIHGLNYNPAKMGNIILFLTALQIDVLSVTLKGHGSSAEEFKQVNAQAWIADFEEARCLIQQDAKTKGLPTYFLGYSLGAAAGIAAQLKHDMPTFDKMILIAPALSLTNLSKLVRIFFWFNGLVLPSKAHEQFRAHAGTPVIAYRALFELVDRIENETQVRALRVPTLVLVDARDELVNFRGLKQLIERRELSNWRMKELNVTAHKLSPAPHHAVIDPFFTGLKLWREIESEISQFLNLSETPK